MGDNRPDMEIEKVIRASVEMTDVPSPELNRKLKAVLREQEAVLQKQPVMRTLSLWYVPMVLNLLTFSMLAFLTLIMIENIYLSYFAAGSCLYVGAAGVLLTLVGLKRANIKEELTVRIGKRGVLV